jgi:TP901 family phage tail tape measure protein
MYEIDRLVVTLATNTGPFTQGMNSVGASLDNISRKALQFGTVLSVSVTAPITALATYSVKSFGDFNQAMTESTSIMGNLGAETKQQMADLARSLSDNAVQTPKMMAESYYFLASAGLDANQSMKALPVTMQFATAGAFDMARATDLLTDAQSALGMTVKDAEANMHNMVRVSDVLVKANTLANASVEQFSVSLTTKAGAALRSVHKDVEEGVAVLAAFADQGTKGELAGTQLAIVIRDLQTSFLDNADAWTEQGLAVYDSTGAMRHMADIVQDLERKTVHMSDEQAKMMFKTLGFADRSMGALQTLLGTSDKIRVYEKALREAGGTAEDVANKQLRSFNNQISMLRNQFINLAIDIGGLLAPTILRINTYVGASIRWFRGLSDETKLFGIYVAIAAAAIGPLLVVLGTMGLAIGGLVSGVSAAFAVVGSVATTVGAILTSEIWLPVVLIVGAIVAIGVALAAAVMYLVGPESLASGWNYVLESAQGFFMNVLGYLSHFQENTSKVLDYVQKNWLTMFLDVISYGAAWVVAMIRNVQVGWVTISRLTVAFLGWIGPQMLNFWTVTVPTYVIEGAVAIVKVLARLSSEIAKILWSILTGKPVNTENLIASLVGDFSKGLQAENFGDVARDILEEQFANVEFAEFKTTLPSLELNLETTAAKKMLDDVSASVDGVAESIQDIPKALESLESIELPQLDDAAISAMESPMGVDMETATGSVDGLAAAMNAMSSSISDPDQRRMESWMSNVSSQFSEMEDGVTGVTSSIEESHQQATASATKLGETYTKASTSVQGYVAGTKDAAAFLYEMQRSNLTPASASPTPSLTAPAASPSEKEGPTLKVLQDMKTVMEAVSANTKNATTLRVIRGE